MKKNHTILIVEDDQNIVKLVSMHLKDQGYVTEHASNGREGLDRSLENEYDLIILDIMLPGMDGLEICRRIRAGNKTTPILMLTAKSEEIDKVVGLEMGADDYITKPFSIREFIARVKAVTRRAQAMEDSGESANEKEAIQYGDLVINTVKRRVSLGGTAVELTPKEFDLLLMFAQNPGVAFNRHQLLEGVWGYQFEGYNHTVNSHINRLRNKIEKEPANPRYIKTVWGYGYRFVETGELE
jgi:DNA-binding response OmpR family regulator